MINEKIKTAYIIMKKSVKTTFMDYSFPILVFFMIIINLYSLLHFEIIYTSYEVGVKNEPIFFSSVFSSYLVVAYGGYLGSKYFAKDIENGRMNNFFLIPDGIKPVLFGKILAGMVVLGALSLVYSAHMFLSLSYWGTISQLTLHRLVNFSILMFLAGVFLFLCTVVIGTFLQKVMPTMLFTSSYLILAFFLSFLIESAEESSDVLTNVFFFPILNIMHNIAFIDEYGKLPLIFFLIPLLSIVLMSIISYILIEGARS